MQRKRINCTATVPVGDLDGDGEIGGTDVILYRRYFSRRLEVLPHPGNADYNADGKVNAKDLLMLRKLLAE